jgi:hypothetical protein
MIKVNKKIVGYAVNQPEAEEKEAKREFKREGGGVARAEVIRMHEKLERPEMLVGSTYKVKTPVSDHKPRPLPVDRSANAHHLCGIPQRWRRRLSG